MAESGNQRPDLSVLRMDPEEMAERRGAGWIGWVFVVLLVAAVGYGIWSYVPMTFLLPEVEVASVRQVTPTQESTVLTATGYTYARKRAAVGAKIIGRILEIDVDEGDTLKKGDLIAVLDSEDLKAAEMQAQASLLEAKAQMADAAREQARLERLVEAGVSAQNELDAAMTRLDVTQAQVNLAEARLESAVANLAYTRIYAPINGVVIEKNVEVGEMVAPGGFTSQQSTGAILRMADPTSLEIEADINESYIARLRRGQPVSIKVDAVPDRAYRGSLRQIVPTADRQRAVVEVKVAIDDRDERLVPDMSCTVTFLEEGTRAEELEEAEPILYVPQAAVRQDGQVLVLDEDTMTVGLRTVELGEAEGQDRVLLSGLATGEKVVISSQEELQDQQQVRLKER